MLPSSYVKTRASHFAPSPSASACQRARRRARQEASRDVRARRRRLRRPRRRRWAATPSSNRRAGLERLGFVRELPPEQRQRFLARRSARRRRRRRQPAEGRARGRSPGASPRRCLAQIGDEFPRRGALARGGGGGGGGFRGHRRLRPQRREGFSRQTRTEPSAAAVRRTVRTPPARRRSPRTKRRRAPPTPRSGAKAQARPPSPRRGRPRDPRRAPHPRRCWSPCASPRHRTPWRSPRRASPAPCPARTARSDRGRDVKKKSGRGRVARGDGERGTEARERRTRDATWT